MEVYLAGFNVDTFVLDELQKKAGRRDDVTPEVFSAAYARISRDKRPINQIRDDARKEVERARKSNETIIFKMGHHSVAEHAVFNLDIIGVSRRAMEEIERFRLCSYTEKSQRYITLDKDFVVPPEVKGTRWEKEFVAIVNLQNQAYERLFLKLKDFVFHKYKDLAQDKKNHSLLEGWAKEDARYITSLSTLSQVGLTINARNLELMLRRFASSDLEEIRILRKMIYERVYEVAPSIIIFHEANDRDTKTYPGLKSFLVDKGIPLDNKKKEVIDDVVLVDFTPDGDSKVGASLIHSVSGLSYQESMELYRKMADTDKYELFKNAYRYMQFYDSLLREFEFVNLTFNGIVSAACFAQLKRHRMMTLTVQGYDPYLGVTIPPSIREIGEEGYFMDVVKKTTDFFYRLKKELGHVASYILTNAHRRRILLRVNARELYHISRLREDEHAQWDIRLFVAKMSEKVKKVMPLTFLLIGPKHKYNEIYRNVFGTFPKVVKPVLPGVRKIKK